MWRYIVAHWQGEQSLPRSVFLNGLLAYVLFLLVAGLAEMLRLGGPFIWVYVGAMLAWLVWATVGIVRRGAKILAERDASWPRKLGAGAAILAATAFALVAASDVYHLFFVRHVSPDDSVRAADLMVDGTLAMDFGTSGPKMLPESFLQPA